MIPKRKYVAKAVEQPYEPCAGTANEFIAYRKKIFAQHHLFKDVDKEFIVWNPTAWQIHPFSFLNPQKKFTVLADGDVNPQVIELGLSVGCLFNIDQKYPQTVKILENYVEHVLAYVHSEGYLAKKIDNNVIGVKNIIFMQDERRARIFDVYSAQLEKKIKENKDLEFLSNFKADIDRFRHSGLAARATSNSNLVEKNAIINVMISI